MITPILLALALAWDSKQAMQYLESRQQQWAAWKPAQKPGGACVSCHTGLPYLFARHAQGNHQPTPLVDATTKRLLSHPPKAMLIDEGNEAVINLLTLALQRRSPNHPLTVADNEALKRLWETQQKDGSWSWLITDLHPVESENAEFYGTTLAALALKSYPNGNPERRAAMRDYLNREAPKQSLHHRLAWVAFTEAKDPKVLASLWRAQSKDGGWTTQSIGPWSPRPDAAPDKGSNAYATAWAAYTAHLAGVPCNDANLKRALNWLTKNQDPATGAWPTPSMNKVYPKGSIQAGFHTDAATGFAAAALAACNVNRS